jgi:alcohol dehydrogenase (cytochrome c)
VVTGRTAWKFEQRAATLSLVTTGGGLVFGGDVAGRFRAHDQDTGAVLWEVNLGSQVTGFPVSYAVNGRQYIAVSTGQAVSTGSYLTLTPEIRAGRNNNLYVFALPANWQGARVAPGAAVPQPALAANVAGAQPLPAVQSCRRSQAPARDASRELFADARFTAAQVEAGKRLYTEQQCAVCHGERMQGTPGAPALAGEDFLRAWRGRSARELLDCMRSTMPPGRVGTLSEAQHAALVAAMLEANGVGSDPGTGRR